jgi:DNA-binding transcriptional ArsR family regulator
MAHDFSQPPAKQSKVLFSPVAELIFASNLPTGTDPGLKPVDEEWRKQQRSQLGPAAGPYLEFLKNGVEWATMSLCDYLPLSGLYEDWEAFRAFVAGRTIDDFLFIIFNREIPSAEFPALYRDPKGAASWVEGLTCFSRVSADAAIAVFANPEGFRKDLLAFVEANRTPAFESRMALLKPRYEARIAAARQGLVGKDPIDFVEELTKKTYAFPRDFRSYAFVPSYFLGDKFLFSHAGGNFLLAFSLNAIAEVEGEQAAEISDRMKVLGDRTRLDILRLLAEGPSYGKAIADRLGLTTATVSRQLDQLKSAGLVLEDRADTNNIKLLRLETSALDELFSRTKGFLGRPSSR